MGIPRALVLLTFISWWVGMLTTAMVAGASSLHGVEVSTIQPNYQMAGQRVLRRWPGSVRPSDVGLHQAAARTPSPRVHQRLSGYDRPSGVGPCLATSPALPPLTRCLLRLHQQQHFAAHLRALVVCLASQMTGQRVLRRWPGSDRPSDVGLNQAAARTPSPHVHQRLLGYDRPSGVGPCLAISPTAFWAGLPSFATKDAPWGSAVVCSSCWIHLLVRWGPVPVLWAHTLQARSRGWPFGGWCCTLPSFGRQAADGHKKSREQRGLHATGCGVPVDFITCTSMSYTKILPGHQDGSRQMLLTEQPSIFSSPVPARQLFLWRWFDDYASIWVFGSSFFYLRQRYQQNLSIVGLFLL